MKRNSVVLALAGLLGLMVLTPAHAENKTVTLSVPGMYCEMCPATVSKALKKINGVEKVAASLEKKEAVVTFDDAKTNVDALRNATANAGYPSAVKK
jgi:periplasmic mercuric ion binding protein